MDDFHKELLGSLVKDWNVGQLEFYITELEERIVLLNEWIAYLRILKRKMTRKQPLDTGVRGGGG